MNVPTAIIHGAKDDVVPSELAEIQHTCIRGSKRYTLEESGHGIMYDQLEEFNEILFFTVQC